MGDSLGDRRWEIGDRRWEIGAPFARGSKKLYGLLLYRRCVLSCRSFITYSLLLDSQLKQVYLPNTIRGFFLN